MKKQADQRPPLEQSLPDRTSQGWASAQESIAESSAIALLLVDGHQPPALAVANNNSICNALQTSPDYVGLCDPFCGAAHARALSENTIIHYRCHAGLHCFAMPIKLGNDRDLAVIGGRAFINGSDYRELVDRFRSGDLQDLAADEVFRNVIFADEANLDHAALSISRAAQELAGRTEVSESLPENRTDKPAAVESDAESDGAEIKPDIARRGAVADTIRRFVERIDASDPAHTYQSIVTESADSLHAERGSLLLLDESGDHLMVAAARGIPTPLNEISPIGVGEGIAGSVLSDGQAMVATIDELGKTTQAERCYKTKSFLSYPLSIGSRKLGVLNLADKIGGGAYDANDLHTVDLMAPQIALALERAGWQQRANQFQLMSITDPLTGLHNRRYLEARLTEELSRSKRYNYPLSFMMIDIDDFKLYNDRNGHQAGDRALEITAQCLKSALRKVDVPSRYGGEEFSILLPQTTLQEAGVIADRIRRKVMSARFPYGSSQPLSSLTVSIGLSAFSPTLDSAEALVRAADRALYHAKHHGKNRAYAYHPPGRRASAPTV